MGHYCRICGRERANERFSGRGHKKHICRDCHRRPKAELWAIEQQRAIYGYIRQSNISARNVAALTEWVESENAETARMAALVLAVAKVKPHRRRRITFLAQNHPDLLNALFESGLVEDYRAWDPPPDPLEDEMLDDSPEWSESLLETTESDEIPF